MTGNLSYETTQKYNTPNRHRVTTKQSAQRKKKTTPRGETMQVRVSVCLNAGGGGGGGGGSGGNNRGGGGGGKKPAATARRGASSSSAPAAAAVVLVLGSECTESLLSAAANKLRLGRRDVAVARLYVRRTGVELPRHAERWPAGAVVDGSLIAITLGEAYAGPTTTSRPPPPPPPPSSSSPSSSTGDDPPADPPPDPIAPPAIGGSDDIGRRYSNLVELWADQASNRTSYYAANEAFWDDDGYGGGTDEEAMIGDDTTCASDAEHSLRLIDEHLRAKYPSSVLRNALDCGAGVGRVTKHVLLKRVERVCLLEGCERWYDQIRRYLGRKRSTRCTFVLGRLEEGPALDEACARGLLAGRGVGIGGGGGGSGGGGRRGRGRGRGGGGGGGGTLFDLIWVQWVSGRWLPSPR